MITIVKGWHPDCPPTIELGSISSATNLFIGIGNSFESEEFRHLNSDYVLFSSNQIQSNQEIKSFKVNSLEFYSIDYHDTKLVFYRTLWHQPINNLFPKIESFKKTIFIPFYGFNKKIFYDSCILGRFNSQSYLFLPYGKLIYKDFSTKLDDTSKLIPLEEMEYGFRDLKYPLQDAIFTLLESRYRDQSVNIKITRFDKFDAVLLCSLASLNLCKSLYFPSNIILKENIKISFKKLCRNLGIHFEKSHLGYTEPLIELNLSELYAIIPETLLDSVILQWNKTSPLIPKEFESLSTK